MTLSRHMDAHLRPTPQTGIPYYDRLMYGTSQFMAWAKRLNVWGIRIEQYGARADFVPAERIMYINPSRFTYLDMLHESRHIGQWRRALQDHGIDIGSIKGKYQRPLFNWFEYGPYNYELRLHQRLLASTTTVHNPHLQGAIGIGFSQDYVDWVNEMLYDAAGGYWNKSNQKAWQYSPTLAAYIDKLWN